MAGFVMENDILTEGSVFENVETGKDNIIVVFLPIIILFVRPRNGKELHSTLSL